MGEPRYYVGEGGEVCDSVYDMSVHERDSELSEVEIVERLNSIAELQARVEELRVALRELLEGGVDGVVRSRLRPRW